MYLPQIFAESDTQALCSFIEAHPLATLVRLESDGICADHIPMLIEPSGDGSMTLRGHVARANPLWKALGGGTRVLAIFQDPGGYITPSWYASKAEHGKVVPTWNYAAVHVYGDARAVDDSAWLKRFLARLTDVNESSRPSPWHLSDAPDDYIATQLRAIVGVEMPVSRLIGKFKMSQNRLPQDVQGVVAGLRAQGDPTSMHMADEVQARRRRP